MDYIPEIMKYSTKKIKYITPISINEMRTNALKKEVFFLDDLLMICKEDSFNSEDGTENMVWNSLEETCRGNVT